MEANTIKELLQKNQKNDAQHEPKMVQKGVPKLEPKSSKVKSWKHIVSRAAPKRPHEPLQDRFWTGFGTILGPFS